MPNQTTNSAPLKAPYILIQCVKEMGKCILNGQGIQMGHVNVSHSPYPANETRLFQLNTAYTQVRCSGSPPTQYSISSYSD